MTGIFIANLSSPDEQRAFDESATRPIERRRLLQHFEPSTQPELREIERQAHGFFVWSTDEQSGPESWNRLKRDDMVIVNYGGIYRHFARVLGRYQNREAAQALWGDTFSDREYLYFISQPVPIELPESALDDYVLETGDGLCEIGEPICDRIETDFGNLERFARLRLLGNGHRIAGYDFDAASLNSEQAEAQARQLADIDHRRGDAELRAALLRAYSGCCAITANAAESALEVAYLIPHRGPETHSPSNALLLRADLHTLFDLGKIAIATADMTVRVSPELFGSSYRILQGRPVRLPDNPDLRPDSFALDLHRRICNF